MIDIAGERRRLADVGFTHRLRDEWRAQFDYTNDRAVDEPATRLFLHITTTNPQNYSSDDAHARAVEAIGIRRFPNTGISYNELILPDGLLYEAQPLTRRGAHTANDFERSSCTTTGCPGRGGPLTAPSWNLNVNARAISLARNVDDPVTDADVQAAARWGAAVKLADFVVRDAHWHGHRCVSSKSCPGDKGWARLDDIADLTVDYVRNGLPGDDDMPTPAELWNYEIPDKLAGEARPAKALLENARRSSANAFTAVTALTRLVVEDAGNDITQEKFDAAHAEVLAAIEAEQP